MVKEKRTNTLEETVEEYARFVDGTKTELLVVIPFSATELYEAPRLKTAFEKAGLRVPNVDIKIITDALDDEVEGLSHDHHEPSVVLLDHYAVSDRKNVFEANPLDYKKGTFSYMARVRAKSLVEKIGSIPIFS